MKVEFLTHEYEFSHGHLPRGRGCWAFEVECESEDQRTLILDPQRHGVLRAEMTDVPEVVQLWTRGGVTYGEAKAQARMFLRTHFDRVSVVVCP